MSTSTRRGRRAASGVHRQVRPVGTAFHRGGDLRSGGGVLESWMTPPRARGPMLSPNASGMGDCTSCGVFRVDADVVEGKRNGKGDGDSRADAGVARGLAVVGERGGASEEDETEGQGERGAIAEEECPVCAVVLKVSPAEDVGAIRLVSGVGGVVLWEARGGHGGARDSDPEGAGMDSANKRRYAGDSLRRYAFAVASEGMYDCAVASKVSCGAGSTLPLVRSKSGSRCAGKPPGTAGPGVPTGVRVTCPPRTSFMFSAHSLAGVCGSAPEEMVGTKLGGEG
ncbi:hypothetical protein B0H13DRAFT_2172671 [Mycena leptocephala]|nr:hypothetical protein B0H13DRAFT_2172671 [Mycena leptocephala]